MIGPKWLVPTAPDLVSRSQSLPWMADSGQSCLKPSLGFRWDCRKGVCGEALKMGVNILDIYTKQWLGTSQKKCHSIYIYIYMWITCGIDSLLFGVSLMS